MRRSIYLLIISMATIGCIIVGTLANVEGRFSDWSVFRDEETNAKLEDASKLNEFDKITIDTDVTNLTIEQGEEYAISYQCTDGLVPKWSVEGGELKVTQKQKKITVWGNNRCSVVITVPEKNNFKKINISSDVGDIKINSIIADYLFMDLDVGDVKIEDCILEKTEIDTDTGDVKVIDSVIKTFDADSDVGDVDIECDYELLNYAYDLQTDVGDISINDEEYKTKYKKNGSSGNITVQSDVGDIKIEYNY